MSARARVADARVRAPSLNEMVQVALSEGTTAQRAGRLVRDDAPDAASAKRRILNLLASNPGLGVCDATPSERRANVLTSIPFLALGADLLRARAGDLAPAGATAAAGATCATPREKRRRLGRGLLLVGASALAYHLTPLAPPTRRALARHADFAAIALAACDASEAYGAEVPANARRASVALAARFPLLVSAAHAGAAEVALWRAARGAATEDDREGLREGREGKARLRRRRCHSAHVAATAAAGVFFVAEEVAPDAPLMHAAWHVFGAAAILAANEATFGDRATRR